MALRINKARVPPENPFSDIFHPEIAPHASEGCAEMSRTLDRDIVDQPGGSDPAGDSLARARHMAVMEGSHGWREGIATPLDAAGGPKEARALPPG
jgi:hypothetical protein